MNRQVLISFRVLAGVALAGACLWGQTLMAQNKNKIVVGSCTNSRKSYATIQEAVDNAAPGSTVLVCPGTYPEQVEISEPLSLIGLPSGTSSFSPVRIIPPIGGVLTNATVTLTRPPNFQPHTRLVAAQIWVHDATRVTLSNLTVDGTGNKINPTSCTPLVGIYLQNASGTVQDVLTRNQETGGCFRDFGALVESDSGLSSTVTVRDSTFRSRHEFGFWAEGRGTNVAFLSNTVEGPGLSSGLNDVTYERATGTIDGNSLINARTEDLAKARHLTTASCGIGLIQAGPAPVTVSRNVIGNTQCGVALYDTDRATISSNTIFETHLHHGVFVCGDGNSVKDNTISDSARAGIYLSCHNSDVQALFPGATANNNKVSNNTINGAVAGILFAGGTVGNRFTHNVFFNVDVSIERLLF